VNTAFSFLTGGLGFHPVESGPDSSLDSVVFVKPPLGVVVGWHKGEVTVDLRVMIDTPILRPYRRKYFSVMEVMRQLQPGALKIPRQLPPSALTVEDALAYVRFHAGLLKDHGQDVLRGDLRVFEAIVQRTPPLP